MKRNRTARRSRNRHNNSIIALKQTKRASDTVDEAEVEDNTQLSGKREKKKAPPKLKDIIAQCQNDFSAMGGVAGVRKEYKEEIEQFVPADLQYEAFKNNPDRNRFNDVVCIDQTRLVLELNVPPETDYIHANTVKLEGYDRVFVATQAPLQNTIQDFWRLVFQTQATSVAVLADPLQNKPSEAAVSYFPTVEGKYENYGEMFVNNRKAFVEDRLQCYMIEVLPDGCSNSLITKVVYVADWADRDIPESPRMTVRLTRMLPAGTCVVTGCAGVGRAGVLMTIDFVLHKATRKNEKPNVKELVKLIRSQRASCVQSERQYLFIYYVIWDYFALKGGPTQNCLTLKDALKAKVD